MTTEGTERRRRTRVPVRFRVTLLLDGREIEVESRDLSLKGMACSPHPLLREKACCQVVIHLAPHVQATIKGQVVRVGEEGQGAAIDFLAMDPESFSHLKRIVECHSRFPEAVASELLTPAFPLSPRRLPVKKPFKKPS